MRKTWLSPVSVLFVHMLGKAQPPFWFGAGSQHCSVAQSTPDNRTFACQVWNGDPQLFRSPLQIEIAHGAAKAFAIGTGEPILEWHFWNDQQIAVHYRAQNAQRAYVLYDTAAGSEVDVASETNRSVQLPQWAKTRTQIEDEAVPESAELTQQRTAWMAKLLRKLGTLHPGMRRKDLSALLTTEGGLSTRFAQTYVSRECPFIKVYIRFKRVNGDADVLTEKPDDVVESVSQPYLGWPTYD